MSMCRYAADMLDSVVVGKALAYKEQALNAHVQILRNATMKAQLTSSTCPCGPHWVLCM